MKLRTALEIYRQEGPDVTTGRAMDGGAQQATRVLYIYLTGEEVRSLTRAWDKRATLGKGEFFATLGAVTERLTMQGHL